MIGRPLSRACGLSLVVLLPACTLMVGDEGIATESGHGDEASTPRATGEPAAGEGTPARLRRVVDGDSLELVIDGDEVEVRLAGLNAPELYGPDPTGGSDRERTCNGQAAKDALTDLVGSGELVVIGSEIDRYGRLLADVVTGGRSVVEAMVGQGNGLATGSDDRLRERMKEAATAEVGLWGTGCGEPAARGLAIGATQVDPPGSDRDNLNEEWVEVVNGGPDPVDLTAWWIRDDTTGHRFPLAGSLGPGARLTVRSGIGVSSDRDFHLGETFPVWSNSGETVLLLDPDGVVVTWAFID